MRSDPGWLAAGSYSRAAAILCAFVLWFLWTPLTSRGFFAPVDLLRDWPLAQRERPELKNYLLSDPAIQFLPFLEWNRAEIARGRLPSWNPYGGWGAPHIANAQSAVFSPFTLPYYVFDWRWALLVAHWAKLFVPGLFAYLFLREIGCAFWPALAGGVLFLFNGFHSVWLLWNHGIASGMAAAALYYLERALRRGLERRALAGIALSLAAGMLAGHPESFFFGAALFAAYAAFRIAVFDGPLARAALLVAAACALGAAISAAQTLPFLEYLRHSAEVSKGPRHAAMPHLHWTSLFLQISPDLITNPSTPYRFGSATNYNELNSAYCGVGAMFLLALAVPAWLAGRNRHLGFALAALAVWGVYAYDPFSLYPRWLSAVPLVGMGVPKRSGGIGAFLVAMVVALTLDRIARKPFSTRLTGAAALAFWTAVFQVMFLALPIMDLGSAAARDVLGWRLAVIAASTAALMIWCLSAPPRWAWILPCVFFAQTGLQFRDYNPTVDAPTLFPDSKAIRAVRDWTGEDQTHWDRSAGLFSALNVPYRFRLTTNYDAIQVGHYDRFAFLAAGRNTPRSFQVLGVRHLVSALPEPGKWVLNSSAPDPKLTREPVAGKLLRQVIRVNETALNAIKVPVSHSPAGPDCRIVLSLFALTPGTPDRLVARRDAACGEFADSSDHWLRIPEHQDSAGKLYRLEVDGARASGDIAVFRTTGWTPDSPDIAAQPNPRPGLYFEAVSGTVSALKLMGSREGFLLYDIRDPLPRFHSVGRAEHIARLDDTLGRVMDHRFDYLRSIVIADPPPARPVSDETAAPRLIEETPTRIRLEVQRATPGWLFALHAHYPGWRAVVNGRDARIWRANGAFTAVEVDAGRSEVVLEYAPLSLRLGIALSLAGLAACAWMARR